jgi:2-oxoglutarate ferredoxin oxidoreductase subunit beta
MVDDMKKTHPADRFLQAYPLPSVWCPGCGIGTAVYSFISAVGEAGIDPAEIMIMTGIGCSGKIAEYLNLRSCLAVDRLLPHALVHKLANPKDRVVVFSNNADLLLSGDQALIEINRQGINLLVIHLNNLIYTITEKGIFANTPFVRTTDDRQHELPFNMPHMARLAGASYVARWTALRTGWLKYSIIDALGKDGLSLIEVLAPCLLFHAADSRIGDADERILFNDRNTVLREYEDTEKLDLRGPGEIVLGRFVDRP